MDVPQPVPAQAPATPKKFDKKLIYIVGGLVGFLVLLILLYFIISGKIRKEETPPISSEVTYTDQGFNPPTLNLLIDDMGTSVSFLNQSNKSVDIKSSNGNNIGSIDPKASKIEVFETPGTYTYQNSLSPINQLTIKIIAAPTQE